MRNYNKKILSLSLPQALLSALAQTKTLRYPTSACSSGPRFQTSTGIHEMPQRHKNPALAVQHKSTVVHYLELHIYIQNFPSLVFVILWSALTSSGDFVYLWAFIFLLQMLALEVFLESNTKSVQIDVFITISAWTHDNTVGLHMWDNVNVVQCIFKHYF